MCKCFFQPDSLWRFDPKLNLNLRLRLPSDPTFHPSPPARSGERSQTFVSSNCLRGDVTDCVCIPAWRMERTELKVNSGCWWRSRGEYIKEWQQICFWQHDRKMIAFMAILVPLTTKYIHNTSVGCQKVRGGRRNTRTEVDADDEGWLCGSGWETDRSPAASLPSTER